MTESTVPVPEGWRVLGFGKHPEVAAAVQGRLQAAGLRARNFALTDDAQGDSQLIRELAEEQYDGVAIGSFINGRIQMTLPTPRLPSGLTECSTSSTCMRPRPRSSSSATPRTRSPRSSESCAHPDRAPSPTSIHLTAALSPGEHDEDPPALHDAELRCWSTAR